MQGALEELAAYVGQALFPEGTLPTLLRFSSLDLTEPATKACRAPFHQFPIWDPTGPARFWRRGAYRDRLFWAEAQQTHCARQETSNWRELLRGEAKSCRNWAAPNGMLNI